MPCAGAGARRVQCPSCRADDTEVVDSRLAVDDAAFRRCQQCVGCGFGFTTYEWVEERVQLDDRALTEIASIEDTAIRSSLDVPDHSAPWCSAPYDDRRAKNR